CFAIVCAWLFAEQKNPDSKIPGNLIAIALYGLVLALLLLQPDLGQAVLVTSIWFVEFYLAGLPILLVVFTGMLAAGGLVGAYYVFPHVHSRIDRFLDPAAGDHYQVN